MKNFQMMNRSHFFILGVCLCSQLVHSVKRPAGEELVPNDEKKQKTQPQIIQEWDPQDEGNAIKVTNSQGDQLTYHYQCFSDKYLAEKKSLLSDSKKEWCCVVLEYKPNLETEKPLLEYVLFNPSAGIYNVTYDKPQRDANNCLVIDPLTFVPKFNGSTPHPDWIFNDNQFGNHFLRDFEGKELMDPQGRTFSIQKAENKALNQIIYSLHVMGPEGAQCINISEYLKRDYGIEVESVGTTARFLNEENEPLALLIYVTDKITSEKSLFVIEIKDILNKNQELPFLRADIYSHSVPIINDKNNHQWKVVVSEILENKMTSQGDRFYYRHAQRKLKNGRLGECTSSLHVIDKEGKDSNINLTYYLDRDFNEQPPEEITKLKLSNDEKYLSLLNNHLNCFGNNKSSYHHIVEIEDIKNNKHRPIYAPIMKVKNYDIFANYYADFITFNADRSVFRDDKDRALLSKYINEIPKFLTIDRNGKCNIEFLFRDQLNCRNLFSITRTIPLFLSEEKKKNYIINSVLFNSDQPLTKKDDVSLNNTPFEPISDIESNCFNPHLLPPEKFSNIDNLSCLLFNQEVEFLLKSFIKENYMTLSRKKIDLLNRIYSAEFLNQFYEVNSCYIKNKDALIDLFYNKRNSHQEDNKPSKFSLYGFLRNTFNDYSLFKNLSCENIYTQEFLEVMNKRNWSPFSNREGVKTLKRLECLLNHCSIGIDLEKNEFFIDNTQEIGNDKGADSDEDTDSSDEDIDSSEEDE